ncbi:MAG: hypothetical protein WB493_04435 [Anaeromyxobacteraceae bacterium]
MEGCFATTRSGAFRAALVALALGATACGTANAVAEQNDFAVRDVAVFVRSDEPFTRASDFPARVESTVEAALEYWGGSWDHLAGRSITFEGAQTVTCGSKSGAFGCYDGNIRLTTRDPAFPFSCVEQTVLVHEIGHAVIGDPNHLDPRWMDFETVAMRLDGRRGYAAQGESACTLFVSVWRHPPDGH